MRCFLLIACILFTLLARAGGGWTYEKGKGFVKVGQNAIVSNQFFNADGDIADITTIGYYATSIFAEYGITDRITAIAYVPFFTRSTLNNVRFRFSGMEIPGDELNSFGDMDLAVKYGFYKSDKWVAAASLVLGIPTGETQGGETGILQTGDGEFNQMLRVDLSRPFGKSAWCSFYAAVNNRTNDFSDEYRLGAEVGSKFGGNFIAIAKLDVVQSFFNGSAEASEGGTIFSNNTEFISPSLELAWELDQGVGFTASVAGAFAARNILASPNFGVGVYYKF